ncbi:uncharacterized protein N7477_009691 [Penicillium maclennaniae]|uniref:uncharacterized protein n=1 Tax=Penicillium maclennaniae TaxID=1343394 RepID=UPI002541DA4C|nr:uncharacterized protein N7477_009691 [Penicillium maclennaniae]KAJ5662075.1 hypothetical protein N7477_009691 [Penicillium maclennaniae]
MSHIDRDFVDIYWINCKRSTNGTTHRMIGLFNPGADRGAWYHCQGCPGARQPTYQYEKRLDSWSFESTQLISRIPTIVVNQVLQQAEAIPPQNCGTWAMYLIFRLEREGLVPAGNYDNLQKRYGYLHRDEDFGPGTMSSTPCGRRSQRTPMPQQIWEEGHHKSQVSYDSKVEKWLRQI